MHGLTYNRLVRRMMLLSPFAGEEPRHRVVHALPVVPCWYGGDLRVTSMGRGPLRKAAFHFPLGLGVKEREGARVPAGFKPWQISV